MPRPLSLISIACLHAYGPALYLYSAAVPCLVLTGRLHRSVQTALHLLCLHGSQLDPSPPWLPAAQLCCCAAAGAGYRLRHSTLRTWPCSEHGALSCSDQLQLTTRTCLETSGRVPVPQAAVEPGAVGSWLVSSASPCRQCSIFCVNRVC